MQKNVNTGVCCSVPIPNDLYHGEYIWLKITKGKSIRINKAELEEILQTGEAMAIMSMDLKNRVVS
jgi:hypothetical protein